MNHGGIAGSKGGHRGEQDGGEEHGGSMEGACRGVKEGREHHGERMEGEWREHGEGA
jgi:hypothetical protein